MKLTAALTVVGLALTARTTLAVPIVGTGGWQAAHAAQENYASGYWDGNSWDSQSAPDGQTYNPCSAGSLLAGTACGMYNGTNVTLAGSTGDFDYWGNADGSADMNFVFGEATGAWYDFALLGEITSRATTNEVGWYDSSNPNNRSAIFLGSQTVGNTSHVYIPGNFGLYYRNTGGSETFFTQTALNGVSGDNQQFAAFQRGNMNYVGVEDLFSHSRSGSDYDYNDAVVSFSRASVPEPSTMLLMGMGLAGIFARVRRRARV